MKTLRRGDNGGAVETLQEALNVHSYGLTVDGDFGPATEDAVEHFQESRGVLDDGVVGRVTWGLLGVKDEAPAVVESDTLPGWEGWKRTVADAYGEGYDSTTLRNDSAARFALARMQLIELGCFGLTSSGGKRKPAHKAKKNQSQKSFHCVGRAHDLFVYSGMHEAPDDPFKVVRDPDHDRYWILYSASNTAGVETSISAWHHPSQSEFLLAGRWVNVTSVLADYGFQRIRARKSYKKSNYGAAEWWHFQDQTGLIRGQSTYGDELLKVWKPADLEGTPAWSHRDAVFGVDWF